MDIGARYTEKLALCFVLNDPCEYMALCLYVRKLCEQSWRATYANVSMTQAVQVLVSELPPNRCEIINSFSMRGSSVHSFSIGNSRKCSDKYMKR